VVRAAGGLMLVDEVQPGFGRLGSHFWGHERIGLVPDVVTIGKPMGNGYPVAAVLARPDVMAAFREAFGYFNTFGGNPVAAAAAIATLEVLQEEGLQENAAQVGFYALDRLRALRHPWLVEVRGAGLFFGAEFIDDDGRPATAFAAEVVERMVARGVLLNRIGRHMNTLKMRPPMPFSNKNADLAIDALAEVLAEVPIPVRHAG
jgi:4-aminobutyrate aminotransferase-like enzyme